ncbi:MAG TPA: methionyl-tRNA formyltransferase [Candidatus Dojkabacteria bacterium]|nr:methionyl-tRNA formyltransferase [Candidatus Dojkabacteria bacterium]HRO65273.1 methionyl-tRNA formyltransferase [Candidatus Dojkabacteria bacterium]HRP50981.1 methionyl-tRNA formyltransferase [Candidatus Dojkabacteria bacterium]
MNKIRTIFFGSGEFAVPILEGLLHMAGVDVVAVVTQMDKPAGRNQDLKPVPVKEFINNNYPDLKVYTPLKYRLEQEEILEKEKPELIIVADYGQILPEYTINYPKYKCLNVHGSILPDLRGAVPIPIAILKGYKKTGVSIPIMTTGLDDGPVLAMTDVEIEDTDTTETLKSKLAKAGAELLERTLPQWVDGKLVPLEQNEKKATIADKTLIEKEKAKITSETDSEKAIRMVRAFYPWPVAWCEIDMNGKVLRLKIFKATISDNSTNAEIGKIYRDGKKLVLNLNDGSIELLDLQLEGKKRAGCNDYLYLSGAKLVS